MNEKPSLYAALGGFFFFNGALVLFCAFFSTWFLGREWVASICSPRCREGFFSELHIHTPAYTYTVPGPISSVFRPSRGIVPIQDVVSVYKNTLVSLYSSAPMPYATDHGTTVANVF